MDEAIRRADEALTEMVALTRDGQVSCGELRRGLAATKALRGKLDAFQADSASVLAVRESHGDGGTGVLAQTAGLSRGEAAGQVKTAQRLATLPEVQKAVEDGRVSSANARKLVEACEKTSAEQVRGDDGLLEKAAELSPEQFAREASRWAAERQEDDGEDAYRRQRARRRLSFWHDDNDGMMHLRGELDPVTGAKLQRRLRKEAERLRRYDVNTAGAEQRSLPQRLADALETLTAGCPGKASVGRGGVSADVTIVQHLTAEGDKAFAEIAGGGTIPQSVFEEHMCSARYRGAVFNSKGIPLWQGHAKSSVTEAQKAALIALYGACGGCGAHHGLCDGHHIDPVSQGGPTDIDNLMLLCWECHGNVHRHGWRVVPDGRGLYTIEPPDRIRHGPAHASDPPTVPGSMPGSTIKRGEMVPSETSRSEPAEARAGPSGVTVARQALREAIGDRIGPSPPELRVAGGPRRSEDSLFNFA